MGKRDQRLTGVFAPVARARPGQIVLVLGLMATACVAAMIPAAPATAGTTIVLTTAADTLAADGACSLREAIMAANTDAAVNDCPAGSGADIITAPSAGTVVLTSALPTITSDITILSGGGAIDADDIGVQVLVVEATGTLRLEQITLTGGNFDFGAGLFNQGTLTVIDSTIAGNTSPIYGAGIYNEGTASVYSSTISGNVTGDGGGDGLGAGVYNVGTIAIVNSTISGNTANEGGAIFNKGSATVSFSTLTDNTGSVGSVGSGIMSMSDGVTDTFVEASIVAGNTGGPDVALRAGMLDTFDSGGSNVIGALGNAVTAFAATDDVTGVIDPQLGDLGFNTGPTLTHALSAGSPAVDRVAGSVINDIATDQRGAPRFGTLIRDAGAYELCPASYSVATRFQLDTAIRCFNASTAPGTYTIGITDDIVYDIEMTAVANPFPDVELIIEGNGHTLDADFTGNALAVLSGTVTLSNTTVTGGLSGGIFNGDSLDIVDSAINGNAASQGAGIYSAGSLTVTRSTISDNGAGDMGEGGGIYNAGGSLTVVDSTISANTAGYAGGIYNAGTASITNSTISGNSAATRGGGVLNDVGSALTVMFSTITANSAPSGSGVIALGVFSSSVVVGASIIAGNDDAADDIEYYFDSNGPITSNGYNVIGSRGSDIPPFAAMGDVEFVADPLLGPLADNGGTTATHALLAGSPAIERVTGTVPQGQARDQRGIVRPQGAAKDSGAYELVDPDDDGVSDPTDNCPTTTNPNQSDLDDDGTGDACDPDDDGDKVNDTTDNCPTTTNPDQADLDDDGTGDACDPDDGRVVFTSASPLRYADSRDEPTFDDTFRNTGPRQGGTVWEVEIAGRGDVPSDASAIVANLTVVDGAGPGFATMFPCGTRPEASSVNYGPGQVEPNELVAKLSPSGTVCVFTLTTANVIIDVVGFVPASTPFLASSPKRFADSRDLPTFDDAFRNTGIRKAGTMWEIQVAGRGDVPDDAAAVVANLTVTNGAGPGFATVYPCGERPNASSINYAPGITRPNELVAKLSPTGTLCVYTLTDVDVILDVVGSVGATPGYTALAPARFADSRDEPTVDDEYRDTGIRAGGTVWEIQIAGRGDVPDDAEAAVANLTVTGATGAGFATVYPCGTRPNASSLNYFVGTTRPNEVIAKLSPTGTLCVFTLTDTHVIIDVVGHT